ncbi:MAG: MFS transporter [Candidatus Moraniibacteriota bacterium]
MKKHQEHLNRKKLWTINLASFLLGFSDAVLIYITSTYFELASGTENVGVFYLVSYVVLLLILLNLHKLAKILGNTSIFFITLFFKIVILSVLAGSQPGVLGILMLMAYVIITGLEWVSLDAILEKFSCDNESGRIRGKHLTILNLGFILGPFLSTRLLDQYEFFGVFLFLLIFNMVVFVFSLIKLKDTNSSFKRDISVSKLIKKVLQRKNILAIYYIAFVLDFFYALMIIYTPIYLLSLGLDWKQIGIIFTAMLLPFVVLQYPLGVLADKKNGEKRMLIFGLFMMFLFTTIFYFIRSDNVLIWSVVLFGTRVGAAMLEVLRDSYFYKRIDGNDVDLIDFFRTAMPVGYIMASFCSFVILLFLPLAWVFVFLALIIASALIPAWYLSENVIEKKQ